MEANGQIFEPFPAATTTTIKKVEARCSRLKREERTRRGGGQDEWQFLSQWEGIQTTANLAPYLTFAWCWMDSSTLRRFCVLWMVATTITATCFNITTKTNFSTEHCESIFRKMLNSIWFWLLIFVGPRHNPRSILLSVMYRGRQRLSLFTVGRPSV